jgi:GNAT superfamily N-acetyltransferase
MVPQIRAISSEDELKKFLTVITRSFSTVSEEFNITYETVPSNPAFITMDKLISLYKQIFCFGLYNDKDPIGFFGLEHSGNSLMIEKLAVIPEFRHNGYGKMILDYTSCFAREKGLNIVSIAMINKNLRLKQWYYDYGFKETEIKNFLHLPFEVCFMQLKIESYKY